MGTCSWGGRAILDMEATTTIIILASALTSSTTLASSSSLMTTSSSTFSAMLASTIMVSLAQGELKQFFLREPDNQTAIEGEQVKDKKSTIEGERVKLRQSLPLEIWLYPTSQLIVTTILIPKFFFQLFRDCRWKKRRCMVSKFWFLSWYQSPQLDFWGSSSCCCCWKTWKNSLPFNNTCPLSINLSDQRRKLCFSLKRLFRSQILSVLSETGLKVLRPHFLSPTFIFNVVVFLPIFRQPASQQSNATISHLLQSSLQRGPQFLTK